MEEDDEKVDKKTKWLLGTIRFSNRYANPRDLRYRIFNRSTQITLPTLTAKWRFFLFQDKINTSNFKISLNSFILIKKENMELTDYQQFSTIDKGGMFKLISKLPEQCQNAWEEISKIVLPSYYLKVNKVLILGMGGSGIGGKLAKSLASAISEIPIITHNNYGVPAWVDEKTLVIAVSYSGGTEEVINGFTAASQKNAKLVAITTGGDLQKFCTKFNCPIYRFDYDSPPRAALGYLFIGVIGILKKLNIIDIASQDLEIAISKMKNILKKNTPGLDTSKNPAKSLAQKIHNKIPIIIGSDLSTDIAFRWKTQFNENAKSASFFEEIPESNHNGIVGLDFPEALSEKIYFILISSQFDHTQSKNRREFLKKILNKKNIGYSEIDVKPTSGQLDEMLGLILLGDLTSYYLSILNDTDPMPVDTISELKIYLKEKSGKS